MKANADKKWCGKEFVIGDWVWHRLQHRSAAGVIPEQPTKLSPRYFGPYKIIEKSGDVSYRLQLPAKAHIHNVFHVTLLKKFEGSPPDAIVPLPPIHHGRVLPVPDKILCARLKLGGGGGRGRFWFHGSIGHLQRLFGRMLMPSS
jgi:hypothetical protein